MELYSNSSITIEIADAGIDTGLYTTMMEFFQSSNFYMKANFIIPYKFVGGDVVLEITGQTSHNYTVVLGDLTWNFTTSISVTLPPENLRGNKMDLFVYENGSIIGSTTIAFAHYAVYIYVFVYAMQEVLLQQDRYRYGRYLKDNDRYADTMEDHWGKLTDFSREAPADAAEYREQLMQWVDSFTKYPAIKKGIVQLMNLQLCKLFTAPKLNAWRLSLGYNRVPTIDRWKNETCTAAHRMYV